MFPIHVFIMISLDYRILIKLHSINRLNLSTSAKRLCEEQEKTNRFLANAMTKSEILYKKPLGYMG